jgi:hypothetical protein
VWWTDWPCSPMRRHVAHEASVAPARPRGSSVAAFPTSAPDTTPSAPVAWAGSAWSASRRPSSGYQRHPPSSVLAPPAGSLPESAVWAADKPRQGRPYEQPTVHKERRARDPRGHGRPASDPGGWWRIDRLAVSEGRALSAPVRTDRCRRAPARLPVDCAPFFVLRCRRGTLLSGHA